MEGSEGKAVANYAHFSSMSHFPAPIHAPSDLAPFHLNGTQDMLTLFELMPLYDRSVRPYLRPDVAPDASEADKAAAHARRATIPKTYWHHVSDIPGKTRIPKRSMAPHMHQELSHILMKPEYTYTPIVPLEPDTLRTAFQLASTTSPQVAGIDYSLLEPEEPEAPPTRKNKHPHGDRPDAPKKRVVLVSKKKRL